MKDNIRFGLWFTLLLLVSVLFSSGVLGISSLNNDILYRYSFDTDYTDYSNCGNGSIQGTPSISSISKIGSGSLKVKGNDMIIYSTKSCFNFLKNRTINLWFRTNITTNPSAIRTLISKNSYNTNGGYLMQVRNSKIRSGFLGYNDIGISNFIPNIHQWYMFTVISNDTSSCIYLDGKNKTCSTFTFIDNNFNFRVGGRLDSQVYGFIGNIDEVMQWNKTLSDTDVTFLYNNGVGQSFPFNENSNITSNSLISPNNISVNGSTLFSWNDFSLTDNSTVIYRLNIDGFFKTSFASGNTTLYNTNYLFDGNHTWFVEGCNLGLSSCVNSTNSLSFSSINTPSKVNITNTNLVIGHISNVTYTQSIDPSNDLLHYNLYLFNVSWVNVTSSNNLYMTYDYSNYNDGNLNQKVEVCDIFNNCVNSTTTSFTVDNTPPFINITYPINEFDFTNGSVKGYCTDNNFKDISFSDDLFIGVNETPFTFVYNGSSSQLNFSVNITCTDYANNKFVLNKIFNFDVNSPLCLGTLDDVTVDYAGHYTWVVSCGDDLNLFLLNVSCKDKSGVNTYNFFIDNINNTFYNFSDVSGSITTDNVCTFTASDSHTKNDITQDINRFNTFVNSAGSGVNLPNYKPIIDYVGVYVINDLSLDFSSSDRVKYVYNFSGDGRRIFDFYVYSNNKIDYVNDDYNAHFVIDNNVWLDFDLNNINDTNFNYVVTKVNDTVYAVSLNTTMSYFKFNSVGIVNTRTYVQNIYARASGYLSTVLDTGVCPESVQGSIILFVLMLFVVFLFVIGLLFNIPILLILASFGVIVLSFSVMGCSTGYGVIMVSSGIIMLVFSFFRLY